MLRAWLRTHCPCWLDVIVKAAAKYLGFSPGPDSDQFPWMTAATKYADRSLSIHHLNLPLRLAMARHNYDALLVLLSCVASGSPPLEICRFEFSAILSGLGSARNSLSAETAYATHSLVGFIPTRPYVYMKSRVLRSAFETFDGV